MKFVALVRWLSISLMAFNTANAQLRLQEGMPSYSIGTGFDYLEDSTHRLSLQDIQSQALQSQFKYLPGTNPNFGFKQSSFWIKGEIENLSTTTVWLFEVGYSAYAEVDLYLINAKGEVIHQQGGDWRGERSRPISFHNFVFRLPLSSTQPYQVYLRVRPLIGQVTIPLTIWSINDFFNYAEAYNLFWGVYMGIMLIVMLFHLFVYLFNFRETAYKGYLFLTLYIAIYLLFELTRGSCLGVRYLWPHFTWMVNNGFAVLFWLVGLLFVSFYGYIFRFFKRVPILMRIIMVELAVWGVVLVFVAMDYLLVSRSALTFAFGGIIGGTIIFTSFWSWRQEAYHRPGLYYFLGALMLYSGGIVLLLTRWGVLPTGTFYTMNALNLGSVLEYIMLAVGLALQIRTEQQNTRLQIRTIQHKQIAELETTYLQAQDDERRQISMLLHDQFSNELRELRDNIQRLYKDYLGTMSAERLKDALGLIKRILEGIGMISHYYMPPEFEQKGLKQMLAELIHRQKHASDINLMLSLKGGEDELPLRVQLQLYYVTFELVSNIIKHAEATEASLVSSKDKLTYYLQIKDNGNGLFLLNSTTKGHGLLNIRKRLQSIQGEFEVKPVRDQGTTFLIKVPLSSLL